MTLYRVDKIARWSFLRWMGQASERDNLSYGVCLHDALQKIMFHSRFGSSGIDLFTREWIGSTTRETCSGSTVCYWRVDFKFMWRFARVSECAGADEVRWEFDHHSERASRQCHELEHVHINKKLFWILSTVVILSLSNPNRYRTVPINEHNTAWIIHVFTSSSFIHRIFFFVIIGKMKTSHLSKHACISTNNKMIGFFSWK